MTVAELIAKLQQFPQDSSVYYYESDERALYHWRKVESVSHGEDTILFSGVFIE